MTTREHIYRNTLEHMESPEFNTENLLTLRPIHPEMFAHLRDRAAHVTQLYLNHQDESCRLKLESTEHPNGATSHKAILESINTYTNDRDYSKSFETEITQEAFDFYLHQPTYPRLDKQRYQVSSGVAIDWIDDNDPLLIIDVTAHIPDIINLSPELYEHVDSPLFDDEFRARRSIDDAELFTHPSELSAEKIAAEITQHQQSGNTYTFVTIGGRSGSGKSTMRQAIIEEITYLLPDTPLVEVSTDDYHRGLTWLTEYNRTINKSNQPWDDWDTRIVYNIDLARREIEQLMQGEHSSPIAKRAYNFAAQEPADITEHMQPAPIIILDGLHAGDPAFDDIAHLRYEVPTGVATSIWRRLDRDFTTGRSIGDNVSSPEKLLRYMVERAEPAYQAQKDIVSLSSTH